MINVDPNTVINLSSSLTSIKLNSYISIPAYIHLSIRILLHYGFAVFWSLGLHQAWSSSDCCNVILVRKQSEIRFQRRSLNRHSDSLTSLVCFSHNILTSKGLLTVCVDVVLISMPVENARTQHHRRYGTVLRHVPLHWQPSQKSKLNYDGVQRVRETNLPRPLHTVTSSAGSSRKHLGKRTRRSLSSKSVRLRLRHLLGRRGLPLCSQELAPCSCLRHANR